MTWKRVSPYLPIGGVVLATLLITQCKVDKLIGPPTGGVLTLTPLSLADSAPLGSAAPRIQRLIVGNGATGRITWTAATARNSTWLRLGAASGTAPDTLPLSLVPGGLALGTYYDTVIVTGAGSSAGELRVPVQFTVQACSVTPITVGTQISGSLGAASCASPHRASHPAALYSFTGSLNDSVSLELTAPAGYVVLDSTLNTGKPSYAESGTCLGVAGNPCLFYQRLPRPGSYIVEVTTNAATDSGAYTLVLSPPRTPGAPTVLAQLQADSATVVPTGDTVSQNTMVFRGVVADPDRPDTLVLEVEAKPTSVAFTGNGTSLSAPVKNGQTALVRIAALLDDSAYHWRARVLDQTGRAGPWLSYGGNAETAPDFVLGNSLVTPSGLGQFRSDGVTILPVGGTNTTRTMIFKGTVSDPVNSEPVRLEVELEPIGSPFTNSAQISTTLAASGSTVQVTSPVLIDNDGYHWQARTVSQTGRTSAWVAFGGNAESVADFNEAFTPQKLVFTVQPGATVAGNTITPAVQVSAEDSLGNVLASFHDTVTMVLDSGPPGAVLSGTLKIAGVAGVATFSTLQVNKSGVARLGASLSSPALNVKSVNFTLSAGSISTTLSTVSASPGTIHASKGDSTSIVTVTVKDQLGNPVPAATVVLSDTATGDSLVQPVATNASGVATGTISARIAGVKTVKATANGQAITQVATVTVLPAHAHDLFFTVQPSSAAAGAAIAPAVQVTARDSLGNVDTSYAGNVTVAIGANPGGSTLSGTRTVAALHGVATFSDLSLDKTGTGYTLTVSAVSVANGATSGPFNIGAGAGTKLAFTVQPSAVVAGANLAPAVQVTAQDASGNTVTTFTGMVRLAIGANPAGGALTGTDSVKAVGGVATFSSVSLDKAGAGYTLTAAATGFTGATSSAFNVRPGPATQLVFTTQPAGAAAGAPLPAAVVTAQDALGNTDTSYTGTVTAAIDSNPGGGVLGGTTGVAAAAGVATFSTLTIDKAGIGYRLAATAASLTRARSNPFTITAGTVSASLSTIIALPASVTAGGTGSTVSVTARDSHGNPIAGASVVLGSTGTGNTLTQPVGTTDSTGLATGSISSTKAESKTISATVGGVLLSQTANVTVTPAAVSGTHSSLGASPAGIAAGGGISVITATARDAFDNPISGLTVLLSVTGTGNTLTQPPSPTDGSGVATGALSSTVAGAKIVTATAGGVAVTQTDTVTVTAGGATHLVFSVQPSNVTAGTAIAPSVQVSALDANNNVATSFTGAVTLAIGTNPGGGTLTGTTPVSAVAGVASFPGMRIDGAGAGYTLTASASGLAGATSATFNVLTGPAAKLGVMSQPSASVVNDVAFPQQPVIQIQDSVGNPVSQSGTVITAAIATGGGTLGGALTATTGASGFATFATLKITGLVGARTLTFTAAGVTAATSAGIAVTAGAATQIAVSGGNHQAATAGSAVGIPPSVVAADVSGNPVSGVGVTFALPGGAGANGSLTGPGQSTNGSGIATVGSWTLGNTAKPDSMTATATGLTGSPLTFVDTAKVGAPAHIAKFSGDSLVGPVATTLSTPHDVLVTDANGNPVPNVTITWAAQSGGSVSPTTNQTDATGHAQATRTLGASPGTETTTATATLGGTPTAVTFTVTAQVGGATQMAANGGDLQKDTVGVTLPVPLSVIVKDALNNPVPGVAISWSVLNGGGTIDSATSHTNASGIASTRWTLGTAMSPVDSTQLVQATGVASPVTFTAFTVPGAVSAAQTSVTATSPVTASTGASQSTITVTARDQFGNVIKGKTVTLGATGSANTVTNPGAATNANGVATGTLSSTTAETKTVTATVGGVVITQQPSVVVAPAAAASLNFVQQPSNVVAGAAIAPAMTVQILDQFGNAVTTATNAVTLALAANPGSSTLSGNVASVPAVGGIATFADASLNKIGTGYTLAASATGLTGQTSNAFNVTSGTVSAAQSSVTATSPITAGGAASTVTVTARDANGNPIAGAAVVLAATGGNNTVTQPGPTNASGVATGAVSSLTAEAKTVSATINSVAVTQTAAVVVNPGAASQVAVNAGAGQTATVATAVTTPPSVIVKDANNNPVPGVAVTFAVTGGGGAVAPTTAVATNAQGIAQVTSWTLGGTAGANTLTATAAGFSGGGNPVTFTATGTPGAADHFAFTQAPTNAAADVAITPTVTVAALDAQGNVATTFTGSITLAIANNAGGGSLSGTTTVPATAGVASFPGISIDKVGTGYTLTASNTGPTPATSAAFNITPNVAKKLVFTQEPTNAVSGATLTPAVTVTALDTAGNVATGFAGTVTLTIANNAGGGTLLGGSGSAAASGVATFSGLSIDKVGTGYTLQAASGALTTATSTGFNVTPGAAAKVAFTVQPTSALAGAAIPVQVSVQDAAGNTVTTFGGQVAIAITTNPGGGTLSGTTPVTAVSGIADFSNLSIDKVGAGYAFTASSGALTTALSTAFNISPAAASQLAFTTEPASDTSGGSLGTIQVAARDQFGNTATGFAGSVTLAIATNPGGGTLSGTSVKTASGGGVAFPGLSIDKSGTGYTLSASAAGVTGATSTAFNVTAGTATHLGFTAQPTTIVAGAAITPPVQVSAFDASNNVAPLPAGSDTIRIGTNPGASILSGDTIAGRASGVSAHSALSLNKVGTGYTLTARSGPLVGATSGTFNVTVGAVSPSQTTVGATSPITAGGAGSTVTVTARDANGNPVPGQTVVLAVSGTGNSITQPGLTDASGVATGSFTSTTAESKTVSATVNAVAITQTATVVVNPGVVSAAQSTVAATSPITASSGASQSAITVTAKDALGNPIAGASVTLAATGTGNTLTAGPLTTNASGVATGTLSSTVAETKTVSATINAVAITQTAAVVVDPGTAANLNFTVQPSAATSGASIAPAIQVEIRDALNNRVTTAVNQVSLAILNNAGPGGTLSGTVTNVSPVSGVATFANASIDKAGTGYTLQATATGLTTATSSPFSITAGSVSAAQSTVSAGSPITASSGTSQSTITVTAKDAAGNPVAGLAVTVAATGTGNTLTQPVGTTNALGVATGTLSSTVAESKTVSATIAGVGVTQTAAVIVNPAVASQLAFSGQPVSDTSAGPLGAVQVTAKDQFGNVAAGFTGTDTVTIATNAGGGTLAGTAIVAATAGVANFPGLSIDKTGTGYTLGAKSGSTITAGASAAFNVTPGNATHLAFTVQPSSATAGATIAPPVVVAVQDGRNNTVTGFTGADTIRFSTNPTGGALAGDSIEAFTAGVATHSSLSINKAGTGYVFAGRSGTLTAATSTAFNITSGTVSASQTTVLATSPITAGGAGSTITVTAKDGLGNPVAGATVVIAVSGTGNLFSQPAVTDASGVTTTTLTSTVAETKTVSATVNSVAITQTASVVVNPGAPSASQSTLTASSPITASTGASQSTITATAKDANGNTIVGATVVLAATGTGNTLTQPAGGVSGAGGVATGTLSATVAESKTVSATIGGVAITQTATVVVNPGAPANLNYVVQPTSAVAGASIAPAIQVEIRDALNNRVTTAVNQVSLAIGTNGGGGTLSGTVTNVTPTLGVATFSNASIDKAGPGYTLSATSTGLATATSSAFAITAGTATTIAAASTPPGSATVGTTVTPPSVLVTDAHGNPVSGVSVTFTVTAGNGSTSPASPAGLSTDATGHATLTSWTLGTTAGTNTVSAASGTLSGSPVAFSVTGTAGTVSGAQSTVSATSPITASTGASQSTVTVTAKDAGGNPIQGLAVVLASTGTGNTLTQPVGTTNALGVATGTLSSTIAESKTVSATIGGVGVTQTATVVVNPAAASQLAFTGPPVSDTSGGSLGAVQVTAKDQFGNVATGFAGTDTVTIGTNAGGGTLSGTAVVAATAGVANFPALSIDKTGTGYTLGAKSGPTITSAASTAFNVTPGNPTHLVFTGQPSNASAGATIAPAVLVTVQDARNNTVTGFAGSDTVRFSTNPTGAALAGDSIEAFAAGVATHSALSVNRAGTGYVLAGRSGTLTPATSTSFTITSGTVSASQTTVAATSPITAGGAGSTITVTAKDGLGNPVAGATVVIAVSGTGNTFAQPAVTDAGGVTTTTLTSTVAETKTVSATVNAVAITQTASVVVNPGAPSASQSTVAAGSPITASTGTSQSTITVTAKDANGNLIVGATVVLAATGSGNTLTQPAGGVSGAGGVATGTLSSTAAESKTVSATIGGVAISQTATVVVNPGTPANLNYVVQPTTAASGAAIAPAIQVEIRDALNNRVTTATNQVSLAIANNAGPGGTLSGAVTNVSPVLGIATFSNASIDKAGTGYTLSATASGLTTATSNGFNITAAGVSAAQSTVAATSPITASTGTSQSTITVTAKDASGNAIAGATVVLAASGTGNTLTQPVGTTNASGVATGTLSSTAAESKVVSATINSVGITQTATVVVNPASASQLTFSAQPAADTAGGSLGAIQVTAKDQFGNVATGFAGTDTVTIANNPGGGTLSGVALVAATAGVANFPGLSINKAGTGYTLGVKSGSGVTAATSSAFNVTPGNATTIAAASTPPASATVGSSVTAPSVLVTDNHANPVAGVSVTFAVTAGNGSISPTTPLTTDAAGHATLTTWTLGTTAGTNTVTATATGLTGSPVSFSVTGTAGTATHLVFSQQPSSAVSGASIVPAITVTALDASNNVATTFANQISLAIANNAGGGTLTGGAAVTPVSGVATFSGVSIDKAGTGYTLSASATSVGAATSSAFNITPGAASALFFTAQPVSDTAAGSLGSIQVTARDAQGNTATGFGGSVSLAIATNPGGGTLSGTTPVTATAGVATFTGMSINKVGAGYTLSTASTGLTGATSTAFNITPGNASQLVFTSQPVSDTAAGSLGTIQVAARDAQGNTATQFVGSVSLAIGANPGGGTLSGTTPVTAVAGVATFSGMNINKSGTGYTLTAASTGLTGATSSTFNITPASVSASQSTVVATSPITASTGSSQSTITVTAKDANGNVISAATVVLAATGSNNTLSASGPTNGSGVYGGTLSSTTAESKTVSATINGVAITQTAAVVVNAGAATQLVFTTQPSNTVSGTPIQPAVVVTAEDAFGNTDLTFTGTVTMTIAHDPSISGSTISNNNQTAVAGVATFTGLTITSVAGGIGYTLGASGGALTGTSAAFNITL